MKWTLIPLEFFLGYFVSLNVFSIAGPTDPCVGSSCGKGAECQFRSNLAVCVCPESSEGDPFVECKPTMASTTTNPTSGYSTSTTERREASTFETSPDFALNSSSVPTVNYTERVQLQEVDDLSSYFPSAPPTLSHYAHTPPFYDPHPQNPVLISPKPNPHVTDSQNNYYDHMNQAQFNPQIRHRPYQHSFQGSITHGIRTMEDQGTSMNQQHSNINNHYAPINLQNSTNGLTHHPQNEVHRNSEQPHNHGGSHLTNNAGFPSYDGTIPTSIPTNPNRISSYPQHPYGFNQPSHQQSTRFSLNRESNSPLRQESAQDKLGIYYDCKTINNRVVCAEMSSTHDSHVLPSSSHLSHTNNHGFEHRLIAVGNDSKNKYHNSLLGGESFQNGGKIQDTLSGHRTVEERLGPTNGHILPGPVGKINYFPLASSTEDHSEAIPVKQNAPTSPNFPETKPYTPPSGSDEAKMCQEMCGEGSVCRVFNKRPVCGCPVGHTGDPAKKCFPEKNSKFDPNTCQRSIDCSSKMSCVNFQCVDPCRVKNPFNISNISSFHESLDSSTNRSDTMCGPNAQCIVTEHIPLCSCEKNYFGNPYIGCVA